MDDNFEDPEPDLERTFKDSIHLRNQHNAQLPISRLPTEILADIFLYCLEHCFRWSSRNIVHLGHVCHHWRTVLVNHPIMWSAPDFSRPLLARMMIHRSKPGPLDVSLDTLVDLFASFKVIISPNSVSVITEALAETSRIRSLKITSVMPTDILQRILSLLDHPMPLLDDLAVRAYNGTTEAALVELPAAFLVDKPILRTLDLHLQNVPWESPMLANITTLKLCGIGFLEPTSSQLLGTLARMPLLEHLTLHNMFPLSFSATPAVVDLPRLQRFDLGAYSSTQCSLALLQTLSHISFPHTASIWMSIQQQESIIQTSFLNGNVQLFRELFERLSLMGKAKALDVFTGYQNNVTLRFWTNTRFPRIGVSDRQFGPEPLVEAVITWAGDPYPLEMFTKHLTRSLSLASLETLYTDMCDGGSMILLESLVHSATLKCLDVSDSDAYALFSLLSTRNRDAHDTTSRGNTVPFPALEDLSLSEVDLRPSSGLHLFPSALDALEARPQKLQRLTLHLCNNITEQQLLRLKTTCIELFTTGVGLYKE